MFQLPHRINGVHCGSNQQNNSKVFLLDNKRHEQKTFYDNRTKSITGIRFEDSHFKVGFSAGLRHAEKGHEENNIVKTSCTSGNRLKITSSL